MTIQKPISYILFDACFTLMDKPELWQRIVGVLGNNGYGVTLLELQTKHKILTEAIPFPDQTTADFYQLFNTKLLYALGIIPTSELLEEIYAACKNLSWEAYEDTEMLSRLKLPMGVLSNFNHSLPLKLKRILDASFEHIFVSETMGVAKPNLDFYQEAIQEIGIPPAEILYIGDSLALDIAPALEVGMQALLIDRNKVFPSFNARLDSLYELDEI